MSDDLEVGVATQPGTDQLAGQVAELARLAALGVLSWQSDHRRALGILPPAWQDRLLVHAVVAFLLAGNLVRVGDIPGEAEWAPVDFDEVVPARLRPDVAADLRRYDRMRNRVGL